MQHIGCDGSDPHVFPLLSNKGAGVVIAKVSIWWQHGTQACIVDHQEGIVIDVCQGIYALLCFCLSLT